MILTQCAVCATELGLSLGKKCGRCSTRYCGPECQVQHWKEGGHDQLCKPIKKAGGAEQYNANNKYAEAVGAAAEACAEDTKGQTCYICTQALHWKTKEGLVRMCGCRGTAGFAHVSCLAEQAKILVAEAEENNLADKAFNERWFRWSTCSLCERDHHGIVRCALGWGCWKTYVGRPETDTSRRFAMTALGNGLADVELHVDALVVREAELAMERRRGSRRITSVLRMQGNLAGSYEALGRLEEASEQYRQVYFGLMSTLGEEHLDTIGAANNYASSFARRERYAEARSLLRKTMPVARRVLPENDEAWFMMRMNFAAVLYEPDWATVDDVREAVTTLEDLAPITRRVLGCKHPTVVSIELSLRKVRGKARAMALSPAEVERLPPAEKRAVKALHAAQLRNSK